MDLEHKRFTAGSFELKALTDAGEFEGYGSVFGVQDSYGDIVLPGAFKVSLAQHTAAGTWPAMLWGHEPDDQCGEWLDLREDERGLYCKGRLWIDGAHPDPDALKVYRGMKTARGKMGLSIGFMTKDYEYNVETGVRTLKEIDLWEVSATPFPANAAARVLGVKAAGITTIRECEAALRRIGLSRREAEALAAHGFKGLASARDERGGEADTPFDARDELPKEALAGLLEAVRSNRPQAA